MKHLRGIVGIFLIILLMSAPVKAYEVYMPHLTGAAAAWGDYLTVDNTGLPSADVTVFLYGDTGNLLYSETHTVPALGEAVIDLKQLSSAAQSGRVRYYAENLNFRLSILNVTAGGVAEFRLTDNQGSILGFYFSDFESVVDWKGIALANYGATSAEVTLYALGEGEVLGFAPITVDPHSKKSGIHSTWFPALAMNEVKKIIAVSSVSTLGGITIASNAMSSSMLFTAAVPMESFAPDDLGIDFTGLWSGEWENTSGYSGVLVTRLLEVDGQVTGTADMYDTDCGGILNAPVTGTVTNDMIAFETSFSCGRYLATVVLTQGSRRGDTIYGSFQENVNGAFYDSGDFWLTKE